MLGVWISAIRPKTLPAIVVPVFLGTILVPGFHKISMYRLLAILIFGLSIQILTNLVNDLFDFLKGADSGNRIGPKRVMQTGSVSLQQMHLAIALTALISIGFGLSLVLVGGIYILGLVILSIILAFLYTAGPFPLAYLGLGEIFVLIFFGPIACGTTYFLLSKTFNFWAYFLGLAPGFISSAILVVNNIRDFESDKLASKNTLVVRFGQYFGKVEYLVFLISAALVPIVLAVVWEKPLLVLPSAFLLFAIKPTRIVLIERDMSKLNNALAQTSLLLIVFAGLFGFAWLG